MLKYLVKNKHNNKINKNDMKKTNIFITIVDENKEQCNKQHYV